MIIRSKFKDYYDSAIAYGVDTTIYYIRESEEVKIPYVGSWDTPQEFNLLKTDTEGNYFVDSYILGFCGVLYPVIKATKRFFHDALGRYNGDAEYKFFYNYEEYKEWKGETKRSYWNDSPKEFFEQFKITDAPFLKYKTPAFLVKYGKEGKVLEKNPCLKDYGFYKMKDAYTAFQDISTYLTNQLVERKEIPEIEDKYKISQHGFDKKSFKK